MWEYCLIIHWILPWLVIDGSVSCRGCWGIKSAFIRCFLDFFFSFLSKRSLFKAKQHYFLLYYPFKVYPYYLFIMGPCSCNCCSGDCNSCSCSTCKVCSSIPSWYMCTVASGSTEIPGAKDMLTALPALSQLTRLRRHPPIQRPIPDRDSHCCRTRPEPVSFLSNLWDVFVVIMIGLVDC